jgi:hypothetical protein
MRIQRRVEDFLDSRDVDLGILHVRMIAVHQDGGRGA